LPASASSLQDQSVGTSMDPLQLRIFLFGKSWFSMFKNVFEMLNSCALVIEISMLFEQIFSLKVVT